MRQRLNRRHQDESSEVGIGNVDLAAMGLEIISQESASVSLDSFDILEPPGARRLLGQDAVKLWIEAVRIDRGSDQFAELRSRSGARRL